MGKGYHPADGHLDRKSLAFRQIVGRILAQASMQRSSYPIHAKSDEEHEVEQA